jgi:hypothetical protein
MTSVACRIRIEGQEAEPKLFWLSCTLELSNFKALVSLLTQVKIDKIQYVDDEGDVVTIETDPELEEAIKLGQKIGELQVIIKPDSAVSPFETHFSEVIYQAEPEVVVPVKEEVEAPKKRVVHSALCNNCEQGIVGLRYKCANCPDYDLCETCEAKHCVEPLHDVDHLFLKITRPIYSYHRSMLPNYYLPPCAPKRGNFGKKNGTKNARITALESKVEVMAQQLETLTTPKVPVVKQVDAAQRAEEKKKQMEEKKRIQEEKRREREERKEQLKKQKEEREQRKREFQIKKRKEKEAIQAQLAAAQAHAQAHAKAVAEARAQADEAAAQVEVKTETNIEAESEPVVIDVQSDNHTFQVEIQPNHPVTVNLVEAVAPSDVDEFFKVEAEPEEEEEKPQEANEFKHELAMLAEMGFTEAVKLLPLLEQHAGDIEAVLAILLG